MRKTTLFLIIILSLLFLNISAQTPQKKEVTITGKVLDKETKQPLEYATVSFFNKRENKIVTGGITDIKGNFSIPVNTGLYNISIEYISFKTITLEDRKVIKSQNIGVFELDLDTESLEAVEIIAEKTTVEIRLDKKYITSEKI